MEPRELSSKKVEVMFEKSRVGEGWCTYSMSKATIWDFSKSRCLMRKRRLSAGVVGMRVEARRRDSVVLWTMVCARSSKTVDCEWLLVCCGAESKARWLKG